MKRFWNEHPGTAVFLVIIIVVMVILVVLKYLSNELWTLNTWMAIGVLAFLFVFLIIIKQQDLENL